MSSAGGAATISVAAVAGHICKLASIDAFTSAGTSTLTVTDGSTVIWRSATAEVTTTRLTRTWTKPLEGSPGAAFEVSCSTSGGGNTVTLNAQIEQISGG